MICDDSPSFYAAGRREIRNRSMPETTFKEFVMKRVVSLFVALVFVVSFVGNAIEAEAKEPSLAQCQGEPSKGTGWGTFWMIIGGLYAIGGGAMIGNPDTYEDLYENPRTVGIASAALGGGLMGLGMGMRHSANKYNEVCTNLLSHKDSKFDFGLEPVAKKATGMKLVYKW